MKKILYLLLVAGIALPLNGCGGGGKKGLTTMTTSSGEEASHSVVESDYSQYYEPLFAAEGEWNRPGLYEKDGRPHAMPKRNVAKATLNVLDYGATPNDPSFDNSWAFEDAFIVAEENPGTEVYVPNGRYYFRDNILGSGYQAHISVRSGTNLRGESREGTILVSGFMEAQNQNNQTTAIIAYGASNCVISDLTITSETDDMPDPDDSRNNTGNYVGPKYGITVDVVTGGKATISTNIIIDNVVVEKYQRMGIRVSRARNVIVENCLIQNSLSLGGGGYGYGVTIQGLISDGEPQDLTNSNHDTLWNIVRNNTIIGPYMRHGVIIQYFAHNNLITNNTFQDILLDSIDLHGEREYANEISFNTVENTRAGYACGVGNSGATHNASGKNNFIFRNTFHNNQGGVNVILGSQQPIIVENTITSVTGNRANGINVEHGPHTKMFGNVIDGVAGNLSYGIRVLYSYDPIDPSANIPDGIHIIGNRISNVVNGVFVEAHTSDFIYQENTITTFSQSAYVNNNSSFVVPVKSDIFDVQTGREIASTAEGYVEKGQPMRNFNGDTKMKLKSTYDPSEAGFQRVDYVKLNLFSITTTPNKVYLKMIARAQNALPVINIYAVKGLDWDETTINWDNSSFHHDTYGSVRDPQTNEIVDDDNPNTEIIPFYDFQFVASDYTMKTHYIDITEAYLTMKANPAFASQDEITLIFANDGVEGVYCEIDKALTLILQ